MKSKNEIKDTKDIQRNLEIIATAIPLLAENFGARLFQKPRHPWLGIKQKGE